MTEQTQIKVRGTDDNIAKILRGRRLHWPQQVPGRCGECGGPRHRQWWLSTPPPSCHERQVAAGRAAA